MTLSNYDILIRKLDEFIRKFYKNQLIRGGIYSAGALLAFFLLLALFEYAFRLPVLGRTILFFSYIGVALVILYRWVILPLAHLNRFGKVITHTQAARIVGDHFPDVRDKLLNTLELKQMASEDSESRILIEASINQRIQSLQPVPFKAAVDLRKNRRYLKYAYIPLGIVLILFLAAPSLIKDPAERLVRYQTHYEKPLPYSFIIENEDLEVMQQEDFLLEIRIEGDRTPEAVFLEMAGGRYRMVRDNPILFHHRFRNVQQDIPFRIVTDRVISPEYTLSIIPRPSILSFGVTLDYPSYTGKQDENLENAGDLTVPEGTRVVWRFQTRDVENVEMRLGEEVHALVPRQNQVVSAPWSARKNLTYSIQVRNNRVDEGDSLKYNVLIIPDAWPQIIVEEFKDSVFDQRLYFRGMIKDDYGFKKLVFHTQKQDEEGRPGGDPVILELPVSQGVSQEQFFHYMDIREMNLGPGEELLYFFEIWDNDGVNGSKASRSQARVFRAPTAQEVAEEYDRQTGKVEGDMSEMLDASRKMMKEIENLRKELMSKESLSWQDKKKVEDLLKKTRELEKQMEQTRQENTNKLQKEQQYRDVNERLMEKQAELEKLFSEIFDDEMKKMLEELQKMLEEFDKDKVNEMMEKMKMTSEELEKELDRNLELFKQLEFEKKLDETIQRMEKLAEEQDKLRQETEKGEKSAEDLKKEQDKLNEEFQNLSDAMRDLEKKNEELSDPFNLEDTRQEEQSIQQDMQQSSGELSKGQQKKAAGKQKSAADKMKQLAEKLDAMQQAMQQEELSEDINNLRMILENLVRVSFRQEKLMKDVAEVKVSDPRYPAMMERQNNIRDDLKLIEDSLIALGKRQVMIQSFVNKKVGEIKTNLDQAVVDLENRDKRNTGIRQQNVMTSVNDLALMLSESLQQMQQQQQNMSGSGKSGCSNPGSNNKGMKGMRQMQEELNKQMEKLKEEMEKGKDPGGKKGSGQSWSEQLARMAAQQEALRRQMEEYREQLNKEGLGNDGEMKKMMQDMEQTETELVNKRITRETIRRQQEILTRMLKSEKAEQEREKEERRESRESKSEFLRNPEEFLEYKRVRSKELEMLRTVPPALKPFYRNKVSEYFYNSGEDND